MVTRTVSQVLASRPKISRSNSAMAISRRLSSWAATAFVLRDRARLARGFRLERDVHDAEALLFAAGQLPVDRLAHAQAEQRRSDRDQDRDLARIDVSASRINQRDLAPLPRGLVLEDHAGVHGHDVFGDLFARTWCRVPARSPASRGPCRAAIRPA